MADNGRGVGAIVTSALPRVLSATLGPILRARGEGDPGFLDPSRRSHADAMSALTRDHWDRLVRAYGLTERGVLLDVACGSGDWLPTLAASNSRVVGVDLDTAMLELARERCGGVENVEIHAMPAESLEFADASFDAVTCFSALPYLDQDRALAEMTRVLRPGGRFVVGTVGSGYYAKHVAEGIRHGDSKAVTYGLDAMLVAAGRAVRGRSFAPASLQAWSPRAVRRLLEDHGLSVERVARDTDAIDPRWPRSFAGRPMYSVTFATKGGRS